MVLEPQVVSALVAAGTSLVVIGGEKLWVQWTGRREERRQTQIRYLYPLKLACDDLLEYWAGIQDRLARGEGPDVTKGFLEVRDGCGAPDFYRKANDFLCGPTGALYATASYFACATKLREELPLVRIPQRAALRLLEATDRVRDGLGGGGKGGLWAEIQDSIGRLVLAEDGHVMTYAAFCRALCKDFDSYFRLFNFYVDIPMKRAHQLAWGYAALVELRDLLGRILRTPTRAPGARAREPEDAARAAA